MKKKRFLHIGINTLAMSLLLLLMSNTGSAMAVLLLLIPALLAVNSLFYGIHLGSVDLLYIASTAVFTTAAVFVLMNSSAWIYIPVYTGMALFFMYIGTQFPKHTQH